MNINIFNWTNKSFDTGIDVSEVASITVTILSGDELFVIVKKNGEVIQLDGASFDKEDSQRSLYCHFEGQYVLTTEEEIKKWLKREKSSDSSWRKRNR